MLLLFSAFLAAAVASPTITLPIANQYPPIALLRQPFYFQFAPSSFTASDGAPLIYTIQSAPPWLSLESNTRTFSGTPSGQNAGPVSFNLTATDGTGSTVTQITLLVAESSPIKPPSDISGQLMRYGTFSGPRRLSYSTSASFNIAFAPNTFTGPASIEYAATSADNSPLPSWVHFDPQTLSFSGLTPPLTEIPQTFGIRLIATLVSGYTGASVTFFIVINDHRLAFQPFERTVSITSGTRVEYAALLNELYLDEMPIMKNQIASAAAETPNWLQFHNGTLVLGGEAPLDVVSVDVRVTVGDIYEDKADALVHFQVQSSLFKGKIGEVNATIGKHFTYTIDRAILSNRKASLSVTVGAAASWLHFDKSTFTLRGNVPSDLHPGVVKASVVATLGSVRDSQLFAIRIVAPRTSKAKTKTPSPSRSDGYPRKSAGRETPTYSASPTPETHTGHEKLSKSAKIGIGIGCGLAVLLAILVVFECRRRRRRAGLPWIATNIRTRFQSSKDKNRATQCEDEENPGKTETAVTQQNVSDAPQIEFKFSSRQRDTSAGSSLPSVDAAVVDNMNRTSLGTDGLTGHVPHDAMKVPAQMARKSSEGFEMGKKRKRRSSYQSRRRSGLPTERVLTGLGHGRVSSRSFGTSGIGNPRASIYDSGSWNTTSTGSDASIRGQIDSFPSAKRTSRNLTLDSVPEDAKRLTIRRVARSGEVVQDTPFPDRRPLEEKRQSYVRRRASTGRSNVIFGSGVGETPSESSSKRSRLAQRSNLYRSRSSSVGVGMPVHSLPDVIRERQESGLETLNDIETADGSSTYSHEQPGRGGEGQGGMGKDVSMFEVPDEGALGDSFRRTQRRRRSLFGWGMGAALHREPQALSKEDRQDEALKVERRNEMGLEMGIEPQSAAGTEAQRLADAGKPASDASSLSGSARFI